MAIAKSGSTRVVALTMLLGVIGSTHAGDPKWILMFTPAPGAPQVFYSPTTARIEDDRGTKIRAVDVRAVAADGQEHRETWKVVVAACVPGKYLDVSIYTNGQLTGAQRSLSLTNTRLDSTRMARVACGLTPAP